MFQKAERKQAKLRLCISGPSGSGKTYSALILAKSIQGDQRIAVIDTEAGSASLYADRFDFDVLNLDPPYTPARFVEAIKSAEAAGYGVIVIDSATHEWQGSGGCLEMNEQTARAKFKGNTWSAWSDTDKQHQKFIGAMLHSKSHIIATARSKTETAQTESGGRKAIVRLGTKLVQKENFEYEFTLAFDLVHDGHFANAIKDRTGLFMDSDPQVITESTGNTLLEWLNSGLSECEQLQALESCFADYCSQFDSAESIEDLVKYFQSAQEWARQNNYKIDEIVASKDKRKAELTPEQAQ